MYALLIIGVYMLINIYIFINFFKWVKSLFENSFPLLPKILTWIVFWLPALCMAAQAYLPSDFLFYRQIKIVSNYWIAVMVYAGFTALLADLVYLILHKNLLKAASGKRAFKICAGIFGVVLTVCMIFFGHLNATHIRIKNFDMTVNASDSKVDNLKIAMIGDLHLGYNAGLSLTESLVEKLNAENLDMVLITGDIFDNDFVSIKDAGEIAECLSGIKTAYGVYSVFGNHDIDENLFCGFSIVGNAEIDDSSYLKFLKEADINILIDESVLIADSVYIVGREDEERAEKMENPRKEISELLSELDKNKAIIVLDHQPLDYEAVEKAGADIELSGHTHNGQVFPGNLTIKLMWYNAYGYKMYGNLQTLVTCGVGSWGPFIRTGTNTGSEIMIINLSLSD